jgi:hypothetical protein
MLSDSQIKLISPQKVARSQEGYRMKTMVNSIDFKADHVKNKTPRDESITHLAGSPYYGRRA